MNRWIWVTRSLTLLFPIAGLVLIGFGYPFRDGAHRGMAAVGLAFALIGGAIVVSDVRRAIAELKKP